MADYKEIRLPLKGELVKQFLEIKKELGVEADTEVLRFLIRDYYKLISMRSGEPLLMAPHNTDKDCKPFSPKEELGGETGYE